MWRFLLSHLAMIAIAIVVVSLPSTSARRNMELVDNGYDLLVGIHEHVKEDNNIIDNLKDILTQASARFYNGTMKRAYIKSVSILVPTSWSAKPTYQDPGKMRYADAEIVVAPPNRKYGDTPYVKALSADCGAPGENMHLTPNYVNDVDGALKKFGDAGKVILHEWGHLRWGLLEEYPNPFGSLTSRFYFSMQSKKYEAVRCSLMTKGRVLRPTGKGKWQTCLLANGMPDHEDCQFYPGFKIKNEARVSVMDRQGTDQVDGFCENTNDLKYQHNYEAPNKMNVNCQGQSAWEVMQKHQDFKGGRNQPREVADVTPKFTILRKKSQKCRVSLVVDRSGSMDTNDKITSLKKGLNKFMKYSVKKGVEVGISSFSNDWTIDCPMREIKTQADRDNFVQNCLKQQATGSTSIGGGLRVGVDNLGKDTKGSRVFILTDGQQSPSLPGPNDQDILDMIDNSGVFVDVVCYTKNADPAMLSLAKRTGGEFYFDSDSSFSNSLNEAFLKDPCQMEDDSGEISVLSAAGRIPTAGETAGGYFYMDQSIGGETRFLIDYKGSQSVVAKVTDPKGDIYGEGSPEYVKDSSFYSITITIPQSKAALGKWKYVIISAANDQDYSINIISRARNSVAPFLAISAAPLKPVILKTGLKNLKETFPDPITVFAEATSGGVDPVLNLTVVALVDRPDSSSLFEFPLKDNGIGADQEKNDGIYSGYFTAYTATGRYSFSVKAEDANQVAVIKSYTKAGDWGSAPLIDENNIDVPKKPEFKMQPISGGISRTSLVGAAEMAAPTSQPKLNNLLKNGTDLIPPTRVLDLEILESSNLTLLRLRWTASWDDHDNSTISNFALVLNTDNSTVNVSIDATSAAYQETKDGDQVVEITIDLKKEKLWQEGGIGIKAEVYAIDEAGNKSPVSNPVTTKITVPPPKPPTEPPKLPTVPPPKPPTEPPKPPTDLPKPSIAPTQPSKPVNTTLLTVLAIVGVGIALSAVAFGIIVNKKMKMRITSRRLTNVAETDL